MPVSAWLPYVRVPDAQITAAKVAERGGTILNGPMEVPRRGSYRPVPGPAGRRLRGPLHEGRVGRGGGLGTTGRRIWRASAESPQPLSEAPLRGRPLARLGCALHGQSQPTQCHTLGLARGAPPPFEPPRGPRFGGGRGRGLNPLPGAGIVPGRLAIECLPGGVSHEQPPDCHRRRSSRASR